MGLNNYKYLYLSEPIYNVMNDIDEYVIPENRRAVEYLWDMNILTTQTNNYQNSDYDSHCSWISIGELDEHNYRLYYSLLNQHDKRKDIPHAALGYGKRLVVPVEPGVMDTFDAFKPLIDLFSFQDVQKDGYMTVDEFLFKYTDCWKYVPNPEYKPLPYPDKKDNVDFLKHFDEYVNSQNISRMIKIVDESKMKHSLEYYLLKNGFLDCYDKEEGKVFYNKRLYDGHMKYKKHINDKKKHI